MESLTEEVRSDLALDRLRGRTDDIDAHGVDGAAS